MVMEVKRRMYTVGEEVYTLEWREREEGIEMFYTIRR